MIYALAFGVAVIPAIPILFTIYSAISADPDLWIRLYQTRLSVILPNTLKLALSVGIFCLLMGVSTAWLVSRYKFFGKRFWEVLLILPFAIPGYIMAYAYASFFAPGGPAQNIWKQFFDFPMPSLYSFWGVSLVLSFVNYPYVYLLARASFLNTNQSYHDVAKSLGASALRRFFSIDLKLAYPGIIAGLLLALMEVMADFGTVALLRYPTFTEAIYRQITGRFDATGGAALASVLLLLSFLLFNLEKYFRGKRSFEQVGGSFRALEPKPLGLVGSTIINAGLSIFMLITFFVPVGIILNMALNGLLSNGWDERLLRFAFNSLLVSTLGASFASLLGFVPAHLSARHPNLASKLIYYFSSLGYSLPGPVVAVGLLLVSTAYLNWLYGSLILLILAYVVRFMPVPLQSQHASIVSLSPSLEQASRTLGKGLWATFRNITIPNIKGGIIVGWVIVFVDCMKELPATMMLRPLGFDTLAVRVWVEASESLWEMASIPALMIVISGLIPLVIVIREFGRGKDVEVG